MTNTEERIPAQEAPMVSISECEKHGLFGVWDYRREVVERVQNLLNARLAAPAQEAQKEGV